MTKKLYDIHYLTTVARNTDLNTWLATAIALGCVGGVIAGKLGARDVGYLLTGAGIGSTVLARSNNKIAEDTRLILNDVDDVSAQTRTNQLFKELSETPVVLQETNWEIVASAGLPVCIRGDHQESLRIAEWLAQKTQGVSVFVSETIEEIKTTQQVVPGTKSNICVLEDILDYRVQTDYEGIIEALNSHLILRRNSDRFSDNLWDLVVILDNPPVIPSTKHSAANNINYVVLGQSVNGWQEVLVGKEAIAYAHKLKDLSQYWSKVLDLWNAGEFPVLVDKKYARLPKL